MPQITATRSARRRWRARRDRQAIIQATATKLERVTFLDKLTPDGQKEVAAKSWNLTAQERRGHTPDRDHEPAGRSQRLSTEMMRVMVQAWDRVDTIPTSVAASSPAGGYFAPAWTLWQPETAGRLFKDGAATTRRASMPCSKGAA